MIIKYTDYDLKPHYYSGDFDQMESSRDNAKVYELDEAQKVVEVLGSLGYVLEIEVK